MNAAIILSGGTGTRLGGTIPKQYIEVEGRSILEHALTPFVDSEIIDLIVIVLNHEWHDYVNRFVIEGSRLDKKIIFARPGKTRQLSIFNGLKALQVYGEEITKVIIHDAARPNVTLPLIENCLNAIDDEYDGAMPVIPVKDTIYKSSDGVRIDSLLDRSSLFAGQAPESFRFGKYYDIHNRMSEEDLLKINGSSELAHLGGMKIKLIPGEVSNYKVTDQSDLERFKQRFV